MSRARSGLTSSPQKCRGRTRTRPRSGRSCTSPPATPEAQGEPVADGVRRRVEDRLRELPPQVLGTLTRRYGQFDACEDATQEALLRAAQHWPEDGIPQSPRGWLLDRKS